MGIELIQKEISELKGKKVLVFFKYNNIPYLIKKSGIVLDCDDKFFILDEIIDGKSTYSYDNVNQIKEVELNEKEKENN
jgi:hypothetical protein